MNSVLENIARHKRLEVQQAKKDTSITQSQLSECPPVRDFESPLLNGTGQIIIAEIKKASPSKGIIREDFDVHTIAKTYSANGAACLSVLTDEHFFKGHNNNLMIARNASSLPVLRKDFIIDPWQIAESRLLGADCILLIVALLEDSQLQEFCIEARSLKMAVLVESHTMEELERALRLPTPLMGVNNRSLHTFDTDIETSVQLVQRMPADKVLISESGIYHSTDIHTLNQYGIHRFLIGESLMREQDFGKKLHDLATIPFNEKLD